MKVWRPKYSNCLIWSVFMYWTNGGYIVFRGSTNGWWFHALWSPDLIEFYAYSPPDELTISNFLQIPPPIFRGVVIYNAM